MRKDYYLIININNLHIQLGGTATKILLETLCTLIYSRIVEHQPHPTPQSIFALYERTIGLCYRQLFDKKRFLQIIESACMNVFVCILDLKRFLIFDFAISI